MGSEMCIRDRPRTNEQNKVFGENGQAACHVVARMRMRQDFLAYLYMSVKNNALVRFQICLYFAAVNYMKVTADPPFIVAEGPFVSPCSPSLPQHNLVFLINSVRYRGILRRDTLSPYVYTSISFL